MPNAADQRPQTVLEMRDAERRPRRAPLLRVPVHWTGLLGVLAASSDSKTLHGALDDEEQDDVRDDSEAPQRPPEVRDRPPVATHCRKEHACPKQRE